MTELRFGLIGRGIGYSMSKSLHERLFRSANINATYDIIDIENIADNIEYLRDHYAGFNVTKPYKVDIMNYLDEIDERARIIGSVNTVVNTNGVLKGYNTDIDGVLATFDIDGIDVEGKKALVIGYGGVSKTIVTALHERGAALINIAGRDNDKIQHLIADSKNVGIEVGSDREVKNKYDIVINATSLGTSVEHGTPIDVCLIRDIDYYFDLIYNPRCTKTMAKCRDFGIKTRDGLFMLVIQAVKSQEYYLGIKHSKETIFDVFSHLAGEIFKKTHNIHENTNIVLVGFMGSGKSSVGRRLASILGMDYVDTDDVIMKRYGDISLMFKEQGEEYFRKKETEVLFDVITHPNTLVATGGGIVMREKNRDILMSSDSLVVYLDATFDKVKERTAGSDRPLFRDNAKARLLYDMRAPLYSEVADIVVDGDGSVDDTIECILAK